MNHPLPPLSKRLRTIVSMTDLCETAADIGCDHGYVPISLCLLGIAKRCIASDVNEGPLKRAFQHAKDYGVSDRIDVRLGNGLTTLKEEEAQCIIISGMGAELMLSILEEEGSKIRFAKELILGPQSEVDKIRSFLCSSGFQITNEKLIEENGKYYPLIKAAYVGRTFELSEEEKRFGPILLKKQDETLLAYLKQRLQMQEGILSGIRNSINSRTSDRTAQLLEDCDLIKKVLNEMTNKIPIILASASPRRKELMRQIGLEPQIIPADVDENLAINEPKELVLALSEIKCLHVAKQILTQKMHKEAMVIAADTIVALNGQILGKPVDKTDAFAMLRSLSCQTHEVLTGVCICTIKDNKIHKKRSFAEITKVNVAALTEEEIKEYIETGEPMDKAGAYGIQGVFGKYIESIEGNYSNVVGLPLSTLYQTMKGMLYEL